MIIKEKVSYSGIYGSSRPNAENQRKGKQIQYLDFARVLRKFWRIKVTVILIMSGAVRAVTKSLQNGLEVLNISGQIENTSCTDFFFK